MAEMSIEEKVGQLTGVVLGPSGVARPVDGPTPGVVLVGPRPLTAMARDLAEAQTRIRATAHRPIPALAVALHEPTDLPALPPTLARAATWDTDLVAELAAATAGPLAAAGIHATAGLSVAPALRRAGWADVAGSLGSDPVLAAELVRAHVYGLQGGPAVRPGGGTLAAVVPDVGGTAGQAVRGVDHGWSERRLRTTVLPASESAIRAGAALVLPAAAANDGVPLHADSRLLQQVLRAEWGFTGVVLASADDVLGLAERHHVAETADAALALAIESGVHIVFGPDGAEGPGGADDVARRMLHLLVEGRLASWLVDAAVVTVLQLKLALGLFDEPVPVRPPLPRRGPGGARGPGRSPVDGAAHRPARGAPPRRAGPGPRGRGRPDGRDAPAGRARWPASTRAARGPSTRTRCGGARPLPSSWWSTTPRGRRARSAGWSPPARRASRSWAAPTRGCSLPLVATTAAVVLCWQPVNVHAEAHADVLLGAAEPGGRLPVPITGDGGRVVCPLGHGAGYTTVSTPTCGSRRDRGPGAAAAGRPVPGDERGRPGRQGGRAGATCATRSPRSPAPRRAWPRSPRSSSQPGRTVTVTLRIAAARLAVWNRAMRHVVEPGTFTVFVGRSAADLRLRGTVVVDSAADLTD